MFYDRMRLAQQEIRATVSVNMFELSCRKRDDDGEISGVRFKKGEQLHSAEGLQTVNKFSGLSPEHDRVSTGTSSNYFQNNGSAVQT